MKIAVYAIAKNESHNVHEWVENMSEADGIFVLDTGSTEGTPSLLEQSGVHVTRMSQKPFRFDHARNEAMSLVPDDYDVLVSVDFDERFVPGWRKAIEENFKSDMASYTLVYSYDEQGNVTVAYPRVAISRRGFGTWKYAVHEILSAPEGTAISEIPFQCVHYGEQKPAGHYFDLLKKSYDDDPKDARSTGYLAREYYAMGNFQMSETLYRAYVQLESHPPFLSEAAGRIASMQTSARAAEWWHRQAILFCDDIRESHCNAAVFYFQQKMYEHAVACTRSAMRLDHPTYSMIYNESYYGPVWCRHMLLACYQQMGNLREGIRIMRELEGLNIELSESVQGDIKTLRRAIQDAYHVYSDCMGV